MSVLLIACLDEQAPAQRLAESKMRDAGYYGRHPARDQQTRLISPPITALDPEQRIAPWVVGQRAVPYNLPNVAVEPIQGFQPLLLVGALDFRARFPLRSPSPALPPPSAD